MHEGNDTSAEADAVANVSSLLRLWRRVPSPIRAILSGFFVFSVIQNGWFTLLLANLQIAPEIPWSIPLGLLWLWLTFRYFGGRGWPASTSADRRRALRAASAAAAFVLRKIAAAGQAATPHPVSELT